MRVKNETQDFQDVYNSALSILEQAIQAVIKCAGILNSPANKDIRGFTEHFMAAHLRVIAGVCYGRSSFDYEVVEEPLIRIYELEPWQYGLFVRKALLEVITSTTLHSPSFEALLQLIPRCKEEIQQSKERGAVAAPQEETLLRKCKEAAWDYLYFSSKTEVGDRGFCEILDRWMKHDDPEIRELVSRIEVNFCNH